MVNFVRTRNVSAAATPTAPPVKDDGCPYLFEMIYEGGKWRGYADTPAELMEGLIPGYSELEGPADRANARIQLALDLRVRLQAVLATHEEYTRCTPEQQQAILTPQDAPPAVRRWDAPVPLVLVSSFYEPVGRLPRPEGPEGVLIWIDPGDEWSLLVSLHEAGAIHVATHETPPPPHLRGEALPLDRGHFRTGS